MIIQDYDWSIMSLHADCERKAFYRYFLGITPLKRGEKGAMEFGGAIDEALEQAYQFYTLNREQKMQQFQECFSGADYAPGRYRIIPAMVARAAFCDHWGTVKNKGYSQELGIDILREYFARYPTEQFDIVDVQCSGSVPVLVINGLQMYLRFKIDTLFFERGKYGILETKTASKIDDLFWLMMTRSYQTDGYALSAESYLGERISLVRVNAIATKQRTGDYKPFDRRDLPRNTSRRAEYDEWLTDRITRLAEAQEKSLLLIRTIPHELEGLEEVMRWAVQTKQRVWQYWPMNPGNCTKFFRACEFERLCGSDCHPAEVKQNYTYTKWKPWMRKEVEI